MDQFLFALVCMAVVPLVNGKPYSISACNETLSINSNLRLHVTFPCALLSVPGYVVP